MRKIKPPVGWEHVKNCFPVPNILLDMDLPASAVAVYLYLLRSADRKTDQCHPSEATIAKRLHLSRNTVAKYVRLLEERGLIITEHTKIITKNGIKKNGNLLYTMIPLQKVMEQHYEQQFNALERTTPKQESASSKNVLGKTQAECKAKLKKAIEESQALDISRANEYTVATWLRTWFELYAKPHIRPSTMNYYHRNIEQHVAPAIGDIPLNKLTSFRPPNYQEPDNQWRQQIGRIVYW